MVSTLAKVAAGALVAKGVGKMMQGGGSGGAGGGLGGMLGGMLGSGGGAGGGLGGMLGGGGNQGAAGGGLGGMLGGMLGGGQQQAEPSRGGMGGMGAAAGAGGLGGMLGGMLAGKGQSGGGLGGMLESLGGGANPAQAPGPATAPTPNSGSMGSVLNSAFENFGEPEQPPTPDQEDLAKIFLRAMIASAKADGQIDQQEREKILGQLGDAGPDEVAFVQAELAAPLDVDAIIRDVPAGSEQQVYLMALMGIDLDNAAEARFLDSLAKGMGIQPEMANVIHDKLGAPKLYS